MTKQEPLTHPSYNVVVSAIYRVNNLISECALVKAEGKLQE
jgi:hypothetical protein